jgi:choline-sulfatase
VHTPEKKVDLLPALVERGTGGAPPDPVDALDGDSLVPLLHADARGFDDRTVAGERLAEGAIGPHLMLKRGHHKYIHSPPDPDQLFDLDSDPDEVENLAGQPEHEDVRRAFEAEVAERWDVQALRDDVVASQRRRRLVQQALMTGRHTPWDFQPFFDASRRYMRNHMKLDDLERTARLPSPRTPEPEFGREER